MTEKRFEFREVNCTAIVPKAYDNEKQQYANLFECVHWLNDLNNEKESWKKSWIEELNDSEEQSKCILKLANENEELKKEIQNLQAKLNILEQAITGDNKQ